MLKATTVIHDIRVSVSVPADGVAAVLGHNGAGMSSLLRAAIGLLKPRKGRIRLDGEDITGLALHQRVARGMAYVPQGQQCFPHLTTAENLQLPTEGIQPTVVAEIEQTILSLAGRGGMSILLVVQHVGFALKAAQRYYVLEAGRVTSTGGGGADAEASVRQALTV